MPALFKAVDEERELDAHADPEDEGDTAQPPIQFRVHT
jgi:hypothetical protein